MKLLLIGHGSAGKRHERNLRQLMPNVEIEINDPPAGRKPNTARKFDAAIIASPAETHGEYMQAMGKRGIPFMCEKPLGTLDVGSDWDKCAVNFQYRFAPTVPRLRRLAQGNRLLEFRAADSLLARYGPNVAGVMASHAIDLALWLLGAAEKVQLVSNGVTLSGHIHHAGGMSTYTYNMDAPERESFVTSGPSVVELDADDGAYVDCLRAWVDWLRLGTLDPRTATLSDGLAVERVLAQVKTA